MEGQFGNINAEMGTPVPPKPISVSTEGGELPLVSNTVATEPPTPAVADKPKEKSGTEGTEDPAQNPNQSEYQGQPQPEDALTEEQITKSFDKLWDSLDPKTIKRLEKLLKEDNEKKKQSLSETSVEFLRMLKLIFAILSLVNSPFKEQKELYTGDDLKLSEIPPEGNDKKYLAEDSNKMTPQDSWNNFRKDVEKMGPMPFGEFMNAVLAANAENSRGITILKPEKEQGEGAKMELLKTLIKNKFDKRHDLSIGRQGRQAKPARAAAVKK